MYEGTMISPPLRTSADPKTDFSGRCRARGNRWRRSGFRQRNLALYTLSCREVARKANSSLSSDTDQLTVIMPKKVYE